MTMLATVAVFSLAMTGCGVPVPSRENTVDRITSDELPRAYEHSIAVNFDLILLNEFVSSTQSLFTIRDYDGRTLSAPANVRLGFIRDGAFAIVRESDETMSGRPKRLAVWPTGELRESVGYQLMNGSQVITRTPNGELLHPHHDMLALDGGHTLTHTPVIDNNSAEFWIASGADETKLQLPRGFSFSGHWDRQLWFAWSEEEFVFGRIRGILAGKEESYYNVLWRMNGSFEFLPSTINPIVNLDGTLSEVREILYTSANSNRTIVSVARLEWEVAPTNATSYIVLWNDGKPEVLPYPDAYYSVKDAVGNAGVFKSDKTIGVGPYAISMNATELHGYSNIIQPSIDEDGNVAAIFQDTKTAVRPYLWTDGKWIDVYAELGLTGRCSRFELMRTGRAALLQIGGSRNYIVRF